MPDEASGVKRTCLHCVLSRALRAEASDTPTTVAYFAPVLLPVASRRMYLDLRALLAAARALAGVREVKLAVADLVGKSHVEVAAVVRCERVHVLACAFPRHVAGTLDGGFCEALPVD